MNTQHTYASYKTVQHNYINQLPTDWQLLPNIAIFEERIERGHDNQQLLSVTIGRGIIKQTDLAKKDSSTIDKSKYLLVYPNDIVYSMRFRQGASGKSDYIGIVSPACTVLKTRESIQINPVFFHYLFRTEFYKNYVESFSYGIADGQIPLRYQDFKRLQSPVPPITTQNQIANYLNYQNQLIDNFIKNKQQLIQLLEERKNRSVEQLITKGLNNNCLFVDSKNSLLGIIPKHWQIKKLRHIASNVKTGTTPSGKTKDYFVNGHFNWFTPGDFNANLKLITSERKVNTDAIEDNEVTIFPANSVLIIGIGGTLGKVGLIDNIASCNQQINAITFNSEIIPEYGLHFLAFLGRHLIASLSYSALPILNQNDTKSLTFLVPPLEEQTAIVAQINQTISKHQQIVQQITHEITLIKEYRSSLITALVTGQRAVPVSFSNHD